MLLVGLPKDFMVIGCRFVFHEKDVSRDLLGRRD